MANKHIEDCDRFNPTVEQTIADMGEIQLEHRLEVSQGFDRGNYANAYETEDYHISSANLYRTTKFFRVAFLLGFFSSYELHEIDEEFRDEVAHYREVFKIVFPEIGI